MPSGCQFFVRDVELRAQARRDSTSATPNKPRDTAIGTNVFELHSDHPWQGLNMLRFSMFCELTGSGGLTLNSASLYLTCSSANGMDPRSCNLGENGATRSLAGSNSATATQTSPLGLAIRYHPNNRANLEVTGSGKIMLGQNGIYAPRSELRMTGSASLGAKTLSVGSVRLTGSTTLRVGAV